jgi:hypothetical protein
MMTSPQLRESPETANLNSWAETFDGKKTRPQQMAVRIAKEGWQSFMRDILDARTTMQNAKFKMQNAKCKIYPNKVAPFIWHFAFLILHCVSACPS